MKSISLLVEPLQILYYQFETLMKEHNLNFIVTCTLRTKLEQEALYAQGRESLEVVNEKRRKAGYPPIISSQNVKVTWTKNSKHLGLTADHLLCRENPLWVGKSIAFDIAILNKNTPVWDIKVDVNENSRQDYFEAGDIGESIGLVWGGRWSPPDYPHFELKI